MMQQVWVWPVPAQETSWEAYADHLGAIEESWEINEWGPERGGVIHCNRDSANPSHIIRLCGAVLWRTDVSWGLFPESSSRVCSSVHFSRKKRSIVLCGTCFGPLLGNPRLHTITQLFMQSETVTLFDTYWSFRSFKLHLSSLPILLTALFPLHPKCLGKKTITQYRE